MGDSGARGYEQHIRQLAGMLCLMTRPSYEIIDNLFFFNDPATPNIYTSSHTLSLHDALPILWLPLAVEKPVPYARAVDMGFVRKAQRSEEHTSELQSRELISYAVFCLKK